MPQTPLARIAPSYAEGTGRRAVATPVIRGLNDPPRDALIRCGIGGGNRIFRGPRQAGSQAGGTMSQIGGRACAVHLVWIHARCRRAAENWEAGAMPALPPQR